MNRSPETELQWLGHATFVLTSSKGTRVLLDPMGAAGYTLEPVPNVDVVTMGHEHGDHNNASLATGNPLILRGLSATGWNSIDQKVKDISIRSVPVYHDDKQGAERGRNTIFCFGVDGLKIVHLSDLGHVLSPEQVTAIGPVDIAMVPVGGRFTIDAGQATMVVQQLSPRIVLPMHYRTSATRPDWPLADVELFLAGKKEQRLKGSRLRVSKATLPVEITVMVLDYK